MASSTRGEASCQSRFRDILYPNPIDTISYFFLYFRPKDCFYDADGGTDHTLKIPFDKCGVKEDGDGFLSQVIVVQHDDWPIFPGDLAFTLQCRRDKDSGTSTARISLSDPDPSSAGKDLPKHKRSTVESKTGQVVFTPDDVRPRKKKKTIEAKTEL